MTTREYMDKMAALENKKVEHKNSIFELEKLEKDLTKTFKEFDKVIPIYAEAKEKMDVMTTKNLVLETWEIDEILKLLKRKIEKNQCKKLDERRLMRIRSLTDIKNNIEAQISE